MFNLIRVLVFVGFINLFSCASQTVYVEGDLTGPPDFSKSESFWLYGIGQESSVNATKICSSKRQQLSKVEVKKTFSDGLWSVLTFGVYYPRTIEVSCKSRY